MRTATTPLGLIAIALLCTACEAAPKDEIPSGQTNESANPASESTEAPETVTCTTLEANLETLELPISLEAFWSHLGLGREPDDGLKSLSGSSGYWTISASYFNVAEGCSLWLLEKGWEDEDLQVTEVRLNPAEPKN